MMFRIGHEQPNALNTPGNGGMMIREIPSSAAMPAANNGPLPPNANIAKCRRSRPRSTNTARMARIIVADAKRSIPCAASSSDKRKGTASSRWIAARAASRFSLMVPPASPPGSRYPSTRLQSVIVRAVPPSP
jgi:hypothetical protein